MSAASDKPSSTVDVDLVAAQFEALDRETHKTALLEAIRARDVYRQLVEDLKDRVEKLERGLIGPKSERFKSGDDPQLSLQILGELLRRAELEGEDAQQLASELLAKAELEALAGTKDAAAEGGDSDDVDDPKVHRRPAKPTGRFMCLISDWPASRVLELAPCNWKKTREQPEAQELIADNLWLSVLDVVDRAHEVEL